MNKKRPHLPKYRVELRLKAFGSEYTIQDKRTINDTIDILKLMGVPVSASTEEFDNVYPHLAWDSQSITQTVGSQQTNSTVTTDMQEFLGHFIAAKTTQIQLTSEYTAVCTATKAIVGCQAVPFERVEAVYKAMLKLKNQ